MSFLLDALRGGFDAVADAVASLWLELTEIRFAGARARQATTAALAVVLSVATACAMHLPDVWWAAISGFISTQPTRPASIEKGVLRIIGTATGATLGLLSAGWLAYDQAACALALLSVTSVGVIGMIVSAHGYAWLFASLTFALVVLMSLADPTVALSVAVFRTFEVVIGTVIAIVLAMAMAPDSEAAPAPPAPGWGDLLGTKWPAVLHGFRGGVAVAAIPFVWSTFYLPGLSAMATTMASVLAVPVLGDHPLDSGHAIAVKALQRLFGCVVGGIAGLVLLALPLTAFVPWLLVLSGGVWVFAYMQGSTRGLGYVGIQAAIVFMMTLVQGEGPPSSILPGINRVVGIILGMTTLLVVCLLVQPGPARRPDPEVA